MQRVKAKADKQRFWIEIPPDVQWVLPFAESPMDIQAGKLTDGSLVTVDRYAGGYSDGIGWVVRLHRNFQMALKCHVYPNSFLRALAHKLGIERFRWENIWLPTDEYLCEIPSGYEELKAYQEMRAQRLEEAGQEVAAVAFRQKVGLPQKLPRLASV